jgi:zinc-ribbon domain
MAFCEHCGTQLSDMAKFCKSCGKPSEAKIRSTPAMSTTRSGVGAKLALGATALLILFGCLGVAAAFYFYHRVSKRAEDVTADLPNLKAITDALPSSGSQPPPASSASPSTAISLATPGRLDQGKITTPEQGQCALFSKEELTRVLETNFTHADADATGCTYKGDAPREIVRTEALWKGGRKLIKTKTDAYAGLRQSMVNLHYSKADIDSHVFPLAPYPGVGDEAWVDLVNIVTARKGDAGVTMDLRYYHDSDETTKMLVNTALSRLAGGSSTSPEARKQP